MRVWLPAHAVVHDCTLTAQRFIAASRVQSWNHRIFEQRLRPVLPLAQQSMLAPQVGSVRTETPDIRAT